MNPKQWLYIITDFGIEGRGIIGPQDRWRLERWAEGKGRFLGWLASPVKVRHDRTLSLGSTSWMVDNDDLFVGAFWSPRIVRGGSPVAISMKRSLDDMLMRANFSSDDARIIKYERFSVVVS